MLHRTGCLYLLQVPGFWNHEGFCGHGQQVCAVLLPGNALHGFSPPPFCLIEHLAQQQPISVHEHTRELQTVHNCEVYHHCSPMLGFAFLSLPN